MLKDKLEELEKEQERQELKAKLKKIPIQQEEIKETFEKVSLTDLTEELRQIEKRFSSPEYYPSREME